ncbi:MAG: response regulator [Chloroflexota bacterium]|nr:response regulator [Chloroflexota bacterium]
MPIDDALLAAGEESPHRILIVEDNPSTSDMLVSYFASLDYEVSHAAWGQDALVLASESPPDLIILDIHLPDIDGYEICTRLRDQRRTKNVPIIFLTERSERMDRLMGLNLGAVDYITKPFDVQELRYRVRNILNREDINTLLHPITELPISTLVEEEIREMREAGNLCLVGLQLQGLKDFGDFYGFVTHDDVLRAVSLILKSTAAEVMNEEPFVGQLSAYEFVIIIPSNQHYLVVGRLHQRLNEAVSFFYPRQDWENGTCRDGSPIPKLVFNMQKLSIELIPAKVNINTLREALFYRQEA